MIENHLFQVVALLAMEPPTYRDFGALHKDTVEAAWAVVEPVLATHHRSHPYKPGTWGPKQADKLIAPNGRWHNVAPADAASKQPTQ